MSTLFRRFAVLLFVLLLIFTFSVLRVHAQGTTADPAPPPFTLADAFVFIGTPAFVGMLLSFLAERWQWFNDHTPRWKTVVSTVGTLLLGVISVFGRTYTPQWLVTAVQPYIEIFLTLVPFITVTVFHKFDKRPETTG